MQRHCVLPKAGRTVRDRQQQSGMRFFLGPSYRKYGFEARILGLFCEGAPITWTFHLEDGPFYIENYFLDVETHEEALRAAGFRGICWHRPQLSPQGEAAYGRDYWSDLLNHPPVTFIECFT